MDVFCNLGRGVHPYGLCTYWSDSPIFPLSPTPCTVYGRKTPPPGPAACFDFPHIKFFVPPAPSPLPGPSPDLPLQKFLFPDLECGDSQNADSVVSQFYLNICETWVSEKVILKLLKISCNFRSSNSKSTKVIWLMK